MAKYDIVIENYQGSVEKHYFTILGLLNDFGYTVLKTKDTFNSSITSSFWGSIEQRRTQQQEKAAQFIAYIGNMTRSMFQLIRTLRIMDQRFKLYVQSKNGPDNESADIALKSLWVDQVEGGAKNPGSVTGMSMQVGFTLLPDIFFKALVQTKEDVAKKIEELKANNMGNERFYGILRRKLTQYINWRDSTEEEYVTSRKFHLAYLRQHFNIIRTYLHWLEPYLRNVKRLDQKGSRDTDILEMADTAISDIELFAFKGKGFNKFIPTITVKFEYRTVPELAYQQEYQKGPIHVGRTHIIVEGNIKLADEIREKFRIDMKKDIKLLGDLTASSQAFGDELDKYIKESKEEDPEGKVGEDLKKGKTKPPATLEDMFGKFKDIGKPLQNFMGSVKTFFGRKKKPVDKVKKKGAPLFEYDLPGPVGDLWKTHKKRIEKMKVKEQNRCKDREDFEKEGDFHKYVKAIKGRNTLEEEKEKKKTDGIKDDWKVYDTFKKISGEIRW